MFRVLLCIGHQHDWRLVLLAAAVCVVATLATFFLYAKTPSVSGWRQLTWFGMTGLVAGSGIWTTHFVAILAFRTGLPTGYAILPTAASLGVAIVSTAAGFALAAAGRRTWLRAAGGGLVVGLGITFMHYLGMSGYRTEGRLAWDLGYVAASVLVGAVPGAAALVVASRAASWWRQALAAALLTAGIVGMHFTGMTAVTIIPDPTVAVARSSLSNAAMATASVAVTALILFTVVAGAALDAASRQGNLRRLRQALDAMPEGIAFFDPDDRLVAWNAKYAALCTDGGLTAAVGLSFSALLAADLGAGVYPDAVGRETAWLTERMAARATAGEALVQHTANGRWLRTTDRATADGGRVSICVDTTELKLAEAAMGEARAEAEAAAAAKGEFLANMSHELRTPLTSIIGFTGMATEQPDLSPLTRDYIGRVGGASRALLCTVNDILDFSKLEAGQVAIHPQPTRLGALTGATLDMFAPQAGAKDLSLLLDDPDAAGEVVVMLDPDRVRQVLLNLVGNAVKFTDAGEVTLRSRYDGAGETLLVAVIDTGAGIPAQKQDALFKRFSQIDGSLSRSHAGTGLGLAICKGLVEAMGGEIGAESAPGQGSRFWFRIPAPRAELAPAAEAAAAGQRIDAAGLRVLVVDDHASNRHLARLFLSGIGAEVSEAEDGEAAVRIAAEAPFDAILMDLRMPNLDGFGALKRIRAGGGANAATPVIAFTADATTELADALIDQGFSGVVAKPIEPARLIAALAEATAFADDAEDPARIDRAA